MEGDTERKTKAGPRRIAVLCVLCVGGAFLNHFFNIFRYSLGIPLFLDTVMTMALTFYAGALWGAATGLLSNLIISTAFFYGWAYYLYALCNMAVALVTALFIRRFPRELGVPAPARPPAKIRRLEEIVDRGVALLLLSLVLCIVISVMGGLIALFIRSLDQEAIIAGEAAEHIDPELPFGTELIRRRLPALAVAIGSRVLINIPDRLISSFAGYGIGLLFARAERVLLCLRGRGE